MIKEYALEELDDELLRAQRYRDLLTETRLTNPQLAFVSWPVRLAMLRGGNQIGKSVGMAWDCVHQARRTHPLRAVRDEPVRLLVAGYSWQQMDPLIRKIWEFLPKDEIDPSIRYEPRNGIRGKKNPVIEFTSGPGRGSIIILATYKQGGGGIMGDTLHGVYGDEPMPETFYGEVIPRLNRHRGFLRLGLTPTLESPPLDYLVDLVEKGVIAEQQVSLKVDTVTPRGGLLDVPWMTAEDIEDSLNSYLAIERPMREHGSYEPIREGRWVDAFDARHWGSFYPPGNQELTLAVAIDHGAKAGRQYAVLIAASEDGERVWFMDEAWSDERTSSRQDAQNILDMLARHHWTWRDVNYWIGDRAHSGDQYGNEKSNADLFHGFAQALRKSKRELRQKGLRIETVYKPKGSVSRGCRLLNDFFVEDRGFLLDGGPGVLGTGCPRLRKGFLEWEGKKDDPNKDPVDAARYGVMKLVDRLVLRPKPIRARVH